GDTNPLEKIPWVARLEEKSFQEALEKKAILFVTGPTGSGRTRFLAEMRLKAQLAGQTDISYFEDTQEWNADAIRRLHVLLRSRLKLPQAVSVVEYNGERISAELKSLLEDPMFAESSVTIS